MRYTYIHILIIDQIYFSLILVDDNMHQIRFDDAQGRIQTSVLGGAIYIGLMGLPGGSGSATAMDQLKSTQS